MSDRKVQVAEDKEPADTALDIARYALNMSLALIILMIIIVVFG